MFNVFGQGARFVTASDLRYARDYFNWFLSWRDTAIAERNLVVGDHVLSYRYHRIFSHHGMYVGGGTVVHYAGKGSVEVTDINSFAKGRKFLLRVYEERKFDRAASVERAQSRLGESLYNVFGNNCEHFVAWCITGLSRSEQIERAGLGATGPRS